ncbi:MAG: Magnesium and cobalt transport protein CorA [uncultured Acetobacteraceae bacterium]|uniref:Magnesium transport protein CorA n=1 Tax=uncultured Acetobacteraceae bacterium TaxID=169975 RepID=A0A6J4J3L6_9PROT|nr:MAG: Magnesium and cobalt transport protein CorA [uncultured Acetobacteraceae bacterium]
MISVFALRNGGLARVPEPGGEALPEGTIWIDLHDPSAEEEARVERLLGLDIRTRDEMAEIEESARLYEENNALYMTATVVAGASERRPAAAQVTFVLTREMLVTVRYADPLPFRDFEARCSRRPVARSTADQVFLALVESVINRVADLFEASEAELDRLSAEIFADDEGPAPARPLREPPTKQPRQRRRWRRQPTDLQAVLKRLGRTNLLAAKLRASLLSVGRMLAYHRQGTGDRLPDNDRATLKGLERDARSLAEHDSQLAAEIAFLLEATLGLIDIEQNRIIKVFSIAAVLFLPPTLVGTVYGMNFEHMPELRWLFGYPFALLLMVVSAVTPYYWFKHRGWL